MGQNMAVDRCSGGGEGIAWLGRRALSLQTDGPEPTLTIFSCIYSVHPAGSGACASSGAIGAIGVDGGTIGAGGIAVRAASPPPRSGDG